MSGSARATTIGNSKRPQSGRAQRAACERSIRRSTRFVSLWSLLAFALTGPAFAQTPVEYLYAESNEGGSSGGHVALRIGDEVFHYQQRERLLALLRTDLADFLTEYALAGNRTLHALRLGVSEETAARLRRGFGARQLAASRQLERVAQLRADRELLEQAVAGVPELALDLPGAGFFAERFPAPAPQHPDASLARVRARIGALYGEGFVASRIEALREQMSRLAPAPQQGWGPVDADAEPPFEIGYAETLGDLASALTAFEVIRDARPLREGSAVAVDPDSSPLEPEARAALCGQQDALEDSLATLAGSSRPDAGGALLLGAARLEALSASCQRGTWLVLDAFAGSDRASLAAPQPRALELLSRDADAARARAQLRLLEGAFDERRLSELEATSARAAELRRAAPLGVLRVADTRPVPARPAPRADLPRPQQDAAALEAVLGLARLREVEAERAVAALQAYHLTSRNCVTELFRTANHALGDSRDAVESALGGYLDPDASGLFVPFVSAAAVRAHDRVVSEREVPSLRALRIAALREREGPLATALRELSPLTARSYERATADSPFLFFADRAPALRPLFGAANLATAAGASLIGLAEAPFDRGARLAGGLRGMLWSLPELAFVGVRKGTNEYVSPEWVEVAKAALDEGSN
ncbi:MAG TPA: hypothetical protein VMW19_01965 [Myxococcota bacterium]|nr:hypothetical protein [Myxococcota bacterium]